MKMNKTPLFCPKEFTTGKREAHLILFSAMQQNNYNSKGMYKVQI